jgi:ABC-type glycerol-3-phosphate transport system substrate-binding protein
MRTRRILLLSLFVFILIVAAISPLMGQGETIITIGVPSWMVDVFRHELFIPFEEQHPGVKVVTVPIGNDTYFQSAAYDLDKHLESAQKYASYADVVYGANYNISVEATRAGYFLDLAPLINGDSSFDSDDFLPKVWQSVQWDGGVWFIPASASVQLLVYDVKAFDKAGVPYPDEKWTLDDFERAAPSLTTYDKDGAVDVPGMQLYGAGLFYYGLTGKTFYDPNVVPSTPKFDDPELVSFLEQWSTLQKDILTQGNFDYNKVPLVLNQPWQLTNPNPDNEQQWAASLLPGGVAGLDVQGFAVSGGTTNPELAYALANFASSSPEVVNRFYGNSPARHSLIGVKAEDSNFVPMPIPKDVQAIIDHAIENAVPVSELRFQDYLDMAMGPSPDAAAPVDMKLAVQDAEVKAVKALETASAKRGTSMVYVLTPVPTPSFSENQIVLHFGLGNDISANRDQWDQLVRDFLAANPEVGNVDIQTQFFDQRDMDKIDCYYQPYNAVSSMNLDDYLSFDPFMDADPAFDRNDFIGPVLDQVKRDDHIWAYPIVIQPAVMWYNPEMFTKADVPSPESGWTVDGFKDALNRLRGVMEKEDDPVFVPGTFGNTYLLMLMAAYGGIPYDYRTTPPTINFTDATNVEAVRQVLDLAKEGYIGYQKLNGNGTVFGGGNYPITDDTLSTYSWRLQNRSNPDFQDPARLANFPSGSEFIPVAYGVGAAYIQSHAQSPDACYKWISLIANRPDLVGGMPARLSQINDSTVAAAQGEDVTALYQGFADTFQKPNTITFPGQFGGSGNFSTYVEPLWLNEAFDNYVLNNGDLDTDLAEAETNANAYRECASTIPELDPQSLTTPEESKAYYKQYVDCAVKIDPTMKSQFSYYYTES